MPGIAQHRNDGNRLNSNETALSGVMTSGKGFWSNQRDDVSFSQLQKFWSELSPQARKKLLKIDKQTLFEQARKNMYCSRCNGLLLEGFLQIVMYGKSLQQEGASSQHLCNGLRTFKNQKENNCCFENGCQDDVQDPSVHPWGGLSATKDGMLTLLDCYLFSNSLTGLQNVFDCARARERERELLYPDACGGGGRGWISQVMAGYGRGHGTRETCALHTARLSVDTLVDFWAALGEETRQSLLRMKEEDFIERLMYRFDSKRFCRDCRRNVIREFKELKELKRMRKEPHCTSWFCVADTPFQCEVSQDTVQADWNRTFVDTFGVYHHFEWAIGTGEGKSDILDFENVGLSGKVQVTGLDLSGLNACYITLRAWKVDGRCTELSVKAHALKGQHCVHCRLGVGDSFVTITKGLSVRRFFEHAEEVEEEEDDDSIDKDGNDLDGECSRPQKHAKSPELAREFLLDAATVIFKEQVEKAFREGTARQNAHSIFVCLALKLLEERVHVSCKEIITLEKQIKLLEEEEKEKREEEERKERRRNKEREKKLRRKERFREKDKDKKCSESNQHSLVSNISEVESTPVDEESNYICEEDVHEICGESTPSSPDIEEEQLLDEFTYSDMQEQSDDSPHFDHAYMKDNHDSVSTGKLQFSRRKLKFQKDFYQDSNMKWPDRRHHGFVSEPGNRMGKHEHRHHVDISEASRHVNGSKFVEKFPSSNPRSSDRHDSYTRTYNQQSEYRIKLDTPSAQVQESKYTSKLESADMPRPCYRGHKNNHVEHVRDSFGRLKSRSTNSHNPLSRGSTNTQRVWEPMESHKKYPRSNSDSDFTLKSSFKDKMIECDHHKPSSTSNSDDSSENSDGRGSSPHIQDAVSSCHETSGSKSPSVVDKEEQHYQNQVQDSDGSQPQISLAQSHNESVHFPIFQPPTVGFYHQSPISWSAAPANGFMSLPHPNHYVFPSPFGFGLNGSTQVMQYGLLQHPPVLNHSPLPVFQHVSQTNGINSRENQKIDNPGGLKESHCNDANLPNIVSGGEHPKGAAHNMENGENGKPSIPSAENTGFSLFHFGGPVALSTGLKSGPVSLKGGTTANVTPFTNLGENDYVSNPKYCGEEYNLFAASNGIKFSLF
ncbi:hypothetical protein LIER_08777 [Lithospermum erythrorhizon]|uniref:Uncharacterized protein n=1 Tax=Lithospermum erythrorhizon TaxID=34254 RepID=A0AAV3PH58_LITER